MDLKKHWKQITSKGKALSPFYLTRVERNMPRNRYLHCEREMRETFRSSIFVVVVYKNRLQGHFLFNIVFFHVRGSHCSLTCEGCQIGVENLQYFDLNSV